MVAHSRRAVHDAKRAGDEEALKVGPEVVVAASLRPAALALVIASGCTWILRLVQRVLLPSLPSMPHMASTGLIPRTTPPRGLARDVHSAFVRWPDPRPLRIVVDRETERDEATEILLGFALHRDVEVISTDPSDGLWHLELGEPDAASDMVPVTVHKGVNMTRTAVHSLRALENVASFLPGPTSDARAALIIAAAAEQANADVFATRRHAALRTDVRSPWRGNPATPEEAVALLGLFLRLRRDFTYHVEGDFKHDQSYSETFDGGMYYWVLMRSLLPAGWQWVGACVASETATGDDSNRARRQHPHTHGASPSSA
jgi:hypothetical protein